MRRQGDRRERKAAGAAATLEGAVTREDAMAERAAMTLAGMVSIMVKVSTLAAGMAAPEAGMITPKAGMASATARVATLEAGLAVGPVR